MAVYEGIGGVARQVANMYEGIGGVARQIVKGWEGIGGVAREFYSGELVLYDNGTTNYTWSGSCTLNASSMSVNGSSFYINQSIDISKYTKLGVTFIDDTKPESSFSYANGNLCLYDRSYSTSINLFDTGYDRKAGQTITKLFDLDTDVSGNDGNIEDFDLTTFQPMFLFMIWNSSWFGGASFYGTILRIWFE